jgi:hypothetical protein
LLVLGKSRFDECLDGRRHLGFDLGRDLKSAEVLLRCYVPVGAGTADSNQHQFPTPIRERFTLNGWNITARSDLIAEGIVSVRSPRCVFDVTKKIAK